MRARTIGSAALLMGLVMEAPGHDARADAVFGSHPPQEILERSLIVFDPVAGRETLVREVHFRGAREEFAFVVPVPEVPEVKQVTASPFESLQTRWDFEGVERARDGRLGDERGVSVVSTERVGSFHTAVLRATDAGGLASWLRTNHFASNHASEAWLERYTRLGFTFVAFRYEKAPRDTSDEMRSETFSLSFATPQPYHPYSEPDAEDSGLPRTRLARIWLISPAPFRPVAAHDQPDARTFGRPWREGWRRHAPRATLGSPELLALLPPGEQLWVQSFVDQKRSHRGWGDVVLVPDQPTTYDEAARASRERLLHLLIDGAPQTGGHP